MATPNTYVIPTYKCKMVKMAPEAAPEEDVELRAGFGRHPKTHGFKPRGALHRVLRQRAERGHRHRNYREGRTTRLRDYGA